MYIVTTLKFRIVILAGSENVPMTKKEIGNVNNSLLILGECFSCLGTSQYIPYRRSKLTWLLKNGLSRNARILLIACVSPSIDCTKETFRTLQFTKKSMITTVSTKVEKKKKKQKRHNLLIAYKREKVLRRHFESILLESDNAKLKMELYKLAEMNADLLEELDNKYLKKGRRVKFKFNDSNVESLDRERKERIINNWETSNSPFVRLPKAKPYEAYFREPINLNAGYLGDKRFEDYPDDFLPKGKFAFLNSSLILLHKRTKSNITPRIHVKPIQRQNIVLPINESDVYGLVIIENM